MNISQRLRLCARHTGLDAVIELLNEAADEIDRLSGGQQADVTDADIVAVMRDGNNCNYNDEAEHIQFARAILALRPTQVNTLAGCNCRWDGDNQVEWCELHLAHKEAIHEWAERAKSAEQKLALRPVQVPMTDEQVDAFTVNGRLHWLGKRQLIRGVEAYYGITANDKKETP